MKRILIPLIICVLACSAAAQSPGLVSSIKPIDRGKPLEPFAFSFLPDGRFRARSVTLKVLIAYLYGSGTPRRLLPDTQISSRPAWVDEDRFDIDAKADIEFPRAWSTPTPEMFALLKALLEDRFKLRVRREAKEVPNYALVFSRRDRRLGPNLRSTPPDCTTWLSGGRRGARPQSAPDRPCGYQRVAAGSLVSSAMSLTQLATLLSPMVGRPVNDRTGLDCTFDLDLHFTPEGRREGNDPVELSIFTAVQEQLGLKLEPAKSAVDFVVIDHVERPAEN